MKQKKIITTNIHSQPREPGPFSLDEQKQLTDFFALLMEWDQQENVTKGESYAESNK